MYQILRKIIFDPIRARVLYDFGFTLITIAITFGLFRLAKVGTLIPVLIGLVPMVFVLVNYTLGVYSWHKMSALWLKLCVILTASLITAALLAYLQLLSLPVMLGLVFSAIGIAMPRIFLNFRTERRSLALTSIIRENAPILIVGGGGYIGSWVVERLLKENYKVRVFDKFLYGRSALADLEANRNLEIIEGDLSDLYALTRALSNVQAVVHLAGIVGDPAASFDPKLTRHVNVIGTRMLKETVKAFRISKFIFASSCSVYGASDKIVDENSNLNPVSLYAQTKIDSETELLEDTYDDFHPTILRFATVFGHSRKPRFDLVANLFVAQAFHNGVITVTNGDQWRPFIHVADLAEAITKVLKAPTEKVSRQIFNVGDERLNATIDQLANLVKSTITDRPVQVATVDQAGDRRNYRVSFRKIEHLLDFRASRTLEEGIAEIYANFKAGRYDKPYTDQFYSNLETTKTVKKEFYSSEYQRTHFSAQP